MSQLAEKELEFVRIGLLTTSILKVIQGMPRFSMRPYYALIRQEIESPTRLGGGGSLVYSRLKSLEKEGFLESDLWKSSNPRAKKKVRFYSLTAKGLGLLRQLEREQDRIRENFSIYG